MRSWRTNPPEPWNRHMEKTDSNHATIEAADLLESVKERRATSRIRSLYLTSYVPKRDERQEYIISIGRTLDVSEGGARIETHRQLDRGVQLELDIAIEDKIVSAKRQVIYSEELSHGLFGTGIGFISIDTEDLRLLR